MTPQSSQFERDSLLLQKHRLQILERQVLDQIKVVVDAAEEMGINPASLRDFQGGWPMISLLNAQANTQLALAMLTKELRRA